MSKKQATDAQAICLKGMTEKEYKDFRKASIRLFAESCMREDGISEDRAKQLAEESFQRATPDGFHTQGQYFFHLIRKGKKIGHLWFGSKPDSSFDTAFLYDIELLKEYRGKGFGKAAMQLLESEALRLGFSNMRLHVFGYNKTAMELYEKCGYRITNAYMAKDLEGSPENGRK